QDPTRLRDPWYQAYAVLTMCRILHTLQLGTVVSKPAAARWAQEALGASWTGLIARALARGMAEPFDHLNETLDFIRLTLDRRRRVDPLSSA
ncbi:MAG: aminoglycoside adenylyltransferase domain-containing protein, partial [Candidatus Rokuibacteriota bacterium]